MLLRSRACNRHIRWPWPVAAAPHEGACIDRPFTANNIRGRALTPFRPATLVVALSLAFATQVSVGADAAASAAAPVAATPPV